MHTSTPMSAPVTIVERFLAEVMSGGRPASASDLIDSDPLQQRVDAFRKAFPDLQVAAIRVVNDGPMVAAHLVGRATHTGVFQGAPPTGRVWSSTCTAIYEVRDGRIVDFWLNWDTLDIVEQLGVVRRSAEASA
jgi:predicted ester cyclase